jgi:AraC-like DNA-binding protein
MIRFGTWSTLLAIGALFGLTVALLLWLSRRNVEANRLLATLIVVIALKLGPYILGFAGAYDAFPWLSFAPFDLGMAIGPLVWLYLQRLTRQALPVGWWRHLIPAAVQLLYGVVLLPMPLSVKDHWNDSVHAPWIDPIETLLEACSIATYLWLSWRLRRAYQQWLDDHVSSREELRLVWLRNFIVALTAMLVVWAPYESVVLLAHFDYYQRFPLYVGLTLLVFYLGLEGWRHASDDYPSAASAAAAHLSPTARDSASDAVPAIAQSPAIDSAPSGMSQRFVSAQTATTGSGASSRDWHAQGEEWLATVATRGWWRDPDLSLDRLAGLLGTNTAYLSRALNEGLGMSFNDAVNRQRVAEIRRCLALPGEQRDLLVLALEVGFSSKTSFNRVFKAQTGQTPTQFRQEQTARRAKS